MPSQLEAVLQRAFDDVAAGRVKPMPSDLLDAKDAPMSNAGVFIVIEGADGVGKQTQTAALAQRFREAGRDVKTFAFPRYATPIGTLIGAWLKRRIGLVTGSVALESSFPADADKMVLQALMLADKADAAAEIRAHVAAGGVVICDRWWQSAVVYGAADGLDEAWLTRACACLPRAHVNILLDVPHKVVRERKPIPDDRYEADAQLQQVVRDSYMRLWIEAYNRGLPGVWTTLAAESDRTPEQVHQALAHTVGNALVFCHVSLGACLA